MQLTIVSKNWGKNNIKALITLKIGGVIFCDGFMVKTGKNGDFLSKPSYQKSNGEYKDYTYFNKELSKLILDNYIPDKSVTVEIEEIREEEEFPFD